MSPNKGGSSPQIQNSQSTSRKRQNVFQLTYLENKNRFSPLKNIDDETEQNATTTYNTAQVA
jgi:hypothetical protein